MDVGLKQAPILRHLATRECYSPLYEGYQVNHQKVSGSGVQAILGEYQKTSAFD